MTDTTHATLTDRYVDAAMRTVPEKQRSDLSAELAASIADQIEARTDAGEDAAEAERAVLTELGDPEVLAAGYTGRQLHLIGPRYYLDWWRLLKLLLWIVIPCAGAAVALGKVLSGAPVGDVIGSICVTMLTAGLHVAFWVTLVFVILERTGHETMDATAWTPEKLPESKQTGARFSDLIASLVWLLILAGAIVWDQVFGLVYLDDRWIPALDPALWPWWLSVFLIVIAVEAIVSFSVYARGRWTYALATVHGILDLVTMVLAVSLLMQNRLINPVVASAITDAAGTEGADAPRIIAILVGAGIVGVAVWDAIDAFLKARRSRSVKTAP